MYRSKLRFSLLLTFLCLTILTGCATLGLEWRRVEVPRVAALDPIYELPTISLAEKEAVLFDAIIARHLNEQGYLLYQSFLPLSDPENYQRSHNSADLPAWHGHWIAALAMELAVAPSPEVEPILQQAVEGLRANFKATGVTGLLGRAYLKYGVSGEEFDQAVETLRMFPDDKRLISDLESEDTHRVQPIANQRINSHYWKTDYFKKATLTDPSERMDIEHSGQDYLFVYWMGRYFGLISEEEATAPVTWGVR